jgi:hypothetical protein
MTNEAFVEKKHEQQIDTTGISTMLLEKQKLNCLKQTPAINLPPFANTGT